MKAYSWCHGLQLALWYMIRLQCTSANQQRMPAHTRAIAATAERVGQFILVVQRQRVLLDEDLAALYGVETRSSVQAVKRKPGRFPPDFMFQLSASEWRL